MYGYDKTYFLLAIWAAVACIGFSAASLDCSPCIPYLSSPPWFSWDLFKLMISLQARAIMRR